MGLSWRVMECKSLSNYFGFGIWGPSKIWKTIPMLKSAMDPDIIPNSKSQIDKQISNRIVFKKSTTLHQQMSEDLKITAVSREERYREVIPQIRALLNGEPDIVANMANAVAALKETLDVLWIGFYVVKGNELVLGPFQGPVACTRIQRGRGVCGTAWNKKATVIVDDVDNFPDHIACSSLSKSEIVLPVIRNDEVVAVLDLDSVNIGDFGVKDEFYLKQVLDLLNFI